jgi:hypothetical protein
VIRDSVNSRLIGLLTYTFWFDANKPYASRWVAVPTDWRQLQAIVEINLLHGFFKNALEPERTRQTDQT